MVLLPFIRAWRSLISELTGISRTTNSKGIKELQKEVHPERIRVSGAGRPLKIKTD
jgi:predicted transcriptional regulator